MNIVGLWHKRGTFAIRFYDKKLHKVNSYFVQFSFVDMWMKPHREEMYDNGSWLCGWLFFYFGNIIAKNE